MSYFVIRNKAGDYFTGAMALGTKAQAASYVSRDVAEEALSDATRKCRIDQGDLYICRVHKKGEDCFYVIKYYDECQYYTPNGGLSDLQCNALKFDSKKEAMGEPCIKTDDFIIVRVNKRTGKTKAHLPYENPDSPCYDFLVVFRDNSQMVVKSSSVVAAIEDTMSFISKGKFAEREEWIHNIQQVIDITVD